MKQTKQVQERERERESEDIKSELNKPNATKKRKTWLKGLLREN